MHFLIRHLHIFETPAGTPDRHPDSYYTPKTTTDNHFSMICPLEGVGILPFQHLVLEQRFNAEVVNIYVAASRDTFPAKIYIAFLGPYIPLNVTVFCRHGKIASSYKYQAKNALITRF